MSIISRYMLGRSCRAESRHAENLLLPAVQPITIWIELGQEADARSGLKFVWRVPGVEVEPSPQNSDNWGLADARPQPPIATVNPKMLNPRVLIQAVCGHR